MSVGRLPPVTPQLPATRPQSAPDVRAAQRAFFAAAVGEQTQPEAPQPRPQPAAQATPGEPDRYLRPGSIIDIKV